MTVTSSASFNESSDCSSGGCDTCVVSLASSLWLSIFLQLWPSIFCRILLATFLILLFCYYVVVGLVAFSVDVLTLNGFHDTFICYLPCVAAGSVLGVSTYQRVLFKTDLLPKSTNGSLP